MGTPREYIPIRVKRYVVAHYGGLGADWHTCDCWLCHQAIYPGISAGRGDGEALSMDHVVPHSRGGSNDRDNLRPAHLLCNQTRKDRLIPSVLFLPNGLLKLPVCYWQHGAWQDWVIWRPDRAITTEVIAAAS